MIDDRSMGVLRSSIYQWNITQEEMHKKVPGATSSPSIFCFLRSAVNVMDGVHVVFFQFDSSTHMYL